VTSLVIGRGDALFLDFDGTLAPIDVDRDKPRLNDAQRRLIETLSESLGGALASVSGRSLADLAERASIGVWRIGAHGAEIAGPGEAVDAQAYRGDEPLLAAASDFAQSHPGVEVELKPLGVALHYRRAPQHECACLAFLAGAAKAPYRIQRGKMVVEAVPADAVKAAAIEQLLARSPFAGRRPIAIGDDATDETMFSAAKSRGGLAVKVGPGESMADLRVSSPKDVWTLLAQGAAALAT
jgi:trehalose 6-phosphate phosphatase